MASDSPPHIIMLLDVCLLNISGKWSCGMFSCGYHSSITSTGSCIAARKKTAFARGQRRTACWALLVNDCNARRPRWC